MKPDPHHIYLNIAAYINERLIIQAILHKTLKIKSTFLLNGSWRMIFLTSQKEKNLLPSTLSILYFRTDFKLR
jgi:hypothetical protein